MKRKDSNEAIICTPGSEWLVPERDKEEIMLVPSSITTVLSVTPSVAGSDIDKGSSGLSLVLVFVFFQSISGKKLLVKGTHG